MVSGEVTVQYKSVVYDASKLSTPGALTAGHTEKNPKLGGTWLPLKAAVIEVEDGVGRNVPIPVGTDGPVSLPRMEIRQLDFAIWLVSVGGRINNQPARGNPYVLNFAPGAIIAWDVDGKEMVKMHTHEPLPYLCGECRYLEPDLAKGLRLLNGASFKEMS